MRTGCPKKNKAFDENETFALSDVMLMMILTIDGSAFRIILRLLIFSARESAALSDFGNCQIIF